MTTLSFEGIYAACVTPFAASGAVSSSGLGSMLEHLERRGCHGALLAGTTGEALSLTLKERVEVFRTARDSTSLPLLAGTGALALEDVQQLTKSSFDCGMDGVLIIPPFFFRGLEDLDLIHFYKKVIDHAVPADGKVLLYHNPTVSDVPVTHELIARLVEEYPNQVVGMKDSSGDWDHSHNIIRSCPEFGLFVGADQLLYKNLLHGGAGSITALANVLSDKLRSVYDIAQGGEDAQDTQNAIVRIKALFSGPPRIASIKFVLYRAGVIDVPDVRLPLRNLFPTEKELLEERFASVFDLAEQ